MENNLEDLKDENKDLRVLIDGVMEVNKFNTEEKEELLNLIGKLVENEIKQEDFCNI